MSCIKKLKHPQLFYPNDIHQWAALELLDKYHRDQDIFVQLVELVVLSHHDEIVLTQSKSAECLFVRALISKFQALYHRIDSILEYNTGYQNLTALMNKSPHSDSWKAAFTARVLCLLKSNTPEVKILKQGCFIHNLKLGDIFDAIVVPCEVHGAKKRPLENVIEPSSKQQSSIVEFD